MSFRDNLQHLRATRNMTQEQLAMLVGVSRQSVTKWESEKSYPEMDKLLRICDVFGVTLDDLVQGDLTNVEPDPALASVPNGPATDICGYDEHMRRYAAKFSNGIAAIFAGLALSNTLGAIVTEPANVADGLSTLALFAGIAVGIAFLVPASSEHKAFEKAHPYVEDFYTQAEKDEAAHQRSVASVTGIVLFMLAVFVTITTDGTAFEDAFVGLALALAGAGAWVMTRWFTLTGRVDLEAYNEEAAEEASADDADNAGLDAGHRDRVVRAGSKRKLTEIVCGIIMLVATVIALLWLFLPAALAGSWNVYGEPFAQLFWLPWVIGGVCCGIASLIIDAVKKD